MKRAIFFAGLIALAAIFAGCATRQIQVPTDTPPYLGEGPGRSLK